MTEEKKSRLNLIYIYPLNPESERRLVESLKTGRSVI